MKQICPQPVVCGLAMRQRGLPVCGLETLQQNLTVRGQQHLPASGLEMSHEHLTVRGQQRLPSGLQKSEAGNIN